MSESTLNTATDVPLLVAAVGNTRARIGLFQGRSLLASVSTLPTQEDVSASLAQIKEKAHAGVGAILIASVAEPNVAPVKDTICRAFPGVESFRVGRDLPIPLRHALTDASTVGHDRLLNAFAAYKRAEQACVVVDVGTAVTVDFIDGEGTFQGGAIAPGLAMMLKALREGTAQLPEVVYERPNLEPDAKINPFGKSTPEAMTFGVTAAVRGLVRELVERYAMYYEAFPQVIATGGDMGVLEGDGLVEHFVPDLQLMGIQLVAEAAMNLSGDDAEDTDDDNHA